MTNSTNTSVDYYRPVYRGAACGTVQAEGSAEVRLGHLFQAPQLSANEQRGHLDLQFINPATGPRTTTVEIEGLGHLLA